MKRDTDSIRHDAVKNYPLWLPGSSFRTKLEEVRVLVRRMMDVPYEMVKAQYVSLLPCFSAYLTYDRRSRSPQTAGTATPCLTTTLLEDHLATRGHDVGRLTPEEEEDIKGVAAVLYAGAFLLFYFLSVFLCALAYSLMSR